MNISIEDALVHAFFEDAPVDNDQLIDAAQLTLNQPIDLARILSITGCKIFESLMDGSCGTTKLLSVSDAEHRV